MTAVLMLKFQGSWVEAHGKEEYPAEMNFISQN